MALVCHSFLVPPEHINVIPTPPLRNPTLPGEKGWKHKWIKPIHLFSGSGGLHSRVLEFSLMLKWILRVLRAFLPLSQCSTVGRAAQGFLQQKSQWSPTKRGSCPQESRRGLCHTLGILQGQGAPLVWPLPQTDTPSPSNLPQSQEGLEPLREMSHQALRKMVREMWNLQLLLWFCCQNSLSALECYCGVENRLSQSCFFQPPEIFSAYLKQK